MQEFVTNETVANQVMLLRDVHDGAILLVEGGSDSLLFKKFMKPGAVRIVVAKGKTRAIEALALVSGRGEVRVLAVVDADFWHITNEVPQNENVAVTDQHDLEMMMIASECSRDVSREVGDDLVADDWEKHRSVLVDAVSAIGRVRLLNYRVDGALNFKDVKLADYVESGSAQIDMERYVARLLEVSPSAKPNHDEVMAAVRSQEQLPGFQVAQGHDLVELMAESFQNGHLGECGQEMDHDSLCSRLRLAYSAEQFFQTRLAQAIEGWARWNGLSVFR